MIEQFKNLCVIKAFDVNDEILQECKNLSEIEGINVVCEIDALDCKICVVNHCVSEVEYQNVLEKVSKLLADFSYCDCDKSLEEVLVECCIEKIFI